MIISRKRERIFEFVCSYFEANGHSPTCEEIGREFGMSTVGAWKHVKELVDSGRLRRNGRYRSLVVPGRIDLRPVPTDALVAELARRRAVSHAEASR